jgi:N-acetylmuramoyl-L-alanine amidase
MNDRTASAWAKLISALAIAIATVLTSLAAVTGQFEGDTKYVEPTTDELVHQVKDAVPGAIVVDGADQDAKKDDVVPIGPDAQEVAAQIAVEENDLAGDLVGDQPTGPVAQLEPPFASEEVPGCRTRFLRTNFSGRFGAAIKWIAPHYTAGRDIPGSRADVDGLTAYGNNPAARVSWHFNIDKDGNCDYNVPLRYKAWTISNANPPTVNFETAGQGEAPYLREGGYRQLARIWKYVHEAYPGIPLRVGSVSNCSSGANGWITHWMTGACGGSHSDIRPHELSVVVANVKRHLARLECDRKCKARRRQAKVVAGRDRKHRVLHAEYRERGCRRGVHEQRLRTYTRPECRTLKRRSHAQHLGRTRAREKLAAL